MNETISELYIKYDIDNILLETELKKIIKHTLDFNMLRANNNYELSQINIIHDKKSGEKLIFYQSKGIKTITAIKEGYLAQDGELISIKKLMNIHQLRLEFFTNICEMLNQLYQMRIDGYNNNNINNNKRL